MPQRLMPLITNEFYHIFNRSIAKQTVFRQPADYKRACELTNFYRFSNLPLRFSHYNRLNDTKKKEFSSSLKKRESQIEIYAFTLMPNHFHFLARQTKDNGIVSFMKLFQESYAKYLNIKTKRTGSVFQSKFKTVKIESEEQLLHLSRYIHLNPLSCSYIKDINELKRCVWNSYGDYVGRSPARDFIQTDLILKIIGSSKKLLEFTADQIDYQRQLQKIKHLALE